MLFDLAPEQIGAQIEVNESEFLKASFGGDRSAAGRYAAEQRWKHHRKKQPKEPRIAPSLREQLSLIGDAMKHIEYVGVSFERYPDLLSKEKVKELNKEIKKLWLEAGKLERRLDDRTKYSEEHAERLQKAVDRVEEACRLAELAVDAMQKAPYDKRFKQELVVARDRHGNLAGMMMVMRGQQEFTDRMTMSGSNSSEDVTGKSIEISFLVSFQTEKGMGRALFGKALKDSAGDNVVQVWLEWTPRSKMFWQKIGFDRNHLSSTDNANLNVRLDEIAGLLP